MARFPQKKAARGSQHWIQFFVNDRPDILNKNIGLGNINWLSPLKSDEFAEYRDKAFLDLLGVRLKKRPPQASLESLKLIVKSLAETASAFHAQSGLDWSHRFYQYANRLAHAFLLKELNDIPTRLLFIYFTGDSEMNGPETVPQWQIAIEELHEALGIKGRVPSYISDVFIDVEGSLISTWE